MNNNTAPRITSHKIAIANGDDRPWTKSRFVLQLGAYGDTILMVWADHLSDAIDEMIDWAVEHEPDMLCDGAVADTYCNAIAAGCSRDVAYDISLEDVTTGGNCGNCIMSHEWHIIAEDPSRADVLRIQGR